MPFQPCAYPENLARLAAVLEPPSLGPAVPDLVAQTLLHELPAAALFPEGELRDPAAAEACLAGLLLLHGAWEQSHRLAQNLETAEGSYWHGLLHRRQPDFPNARYWFRQTGGHPVHPAVLTAAQELVEAAGPAAGSEVAFLRQAARWSPFAFVDWCEAILARGQPGESLARQIAHAEWQILFDFCYRRATGREV